MFFLQSKRRTFINTQLGPWSRVLEKLTVAELVKKLPTLYGTRRSLSCSQASATGHYPDPEKSTPNPTHCSLRPNLRLNLQNIVSDQQLVCICHLSHACYIPAHLILLDLITLTIMAKNMFRQSESHDTIFTWAYVILVRNLTWSVEDDGVLLQLLTSIF
jgi:hypothetical protein